MNTDSLLWSAMSFFCKRQIRSTCQVALLCTLLWTGWHLNLTSSCDMTSFELITSFQSVDFFRVYHSVWEYGFICIWNYYCRKPSVLLKDENRFSKSNNHTHILINKLSHQNGLEFQMIDTSQRWFSRWKWFLCYQFVEFSLIRHGWSERIKCVCMLRTLY